MVEQDKTDTEPKLFSINDFFDKEVSLIGKEFTFESIDAPERQYFEFHIKNVK